ncbi:hypothetical protein [Streptomyces cadmiisoli]|uniref:Uncharacterized protein n=1 Tax=Streptomyces cadmiisoli TaxID=2184053 RepID=A0A2Z4JFA5_9ACTN|nr:hypothetical protein [Streptomyces cadmiisoli]AWW43343.1 hypothetical protein DN051_43010 [Streptomyces cadmiisoli]
MTIVVGTVRYEPAGKNPRMAIEQLVAALRAAGLGSGAFGRHLSRQILAPTDHLYASYQELVASLTDMQVNGAARQQGGDNTEESAAQHVGAWTGRGNAWPTWAQADTQLAPGGQDPTLYAQGSGPTKQGAPVKVDIWSEHLVGIVGGAAKNDNVEKFINACKTLRKVADSHGKQAVVFAAFGTSQPIVDCAVVAVGAPHTYVQDAPGGPWRPKG